MIAVDPLLLAKRQLGRDRDRTARFPALFARKIARMTASPLAFLRGAAPLFYEILAARPSLAEGARGKGWIAGDLHLENFGAYRPDPLVDPRGAARHRHHEVAAFDLNDFDDAVIGPWRLDLLRLATSLILGGRELGADGHRALELCDALLESHARAAFDGDVDALRAPPPPVAKLVAQAASRSRRALLDARTETVHGERRFVRGERYLDLPRALAAEAPKAFARYARSLDARDRPSDDALEVLDVAQRVAGTGSLGGVRVAVLVRGKGGDGGAWIFDMKEQGRPSAERLLGAGCTGDLAPAERVAAALRASLARPPRLLGTTRLRSLSMLVRRLTPQEDKLDLATLHDRDLPPLARYLGALVGRAHARAATKPPKKRWSRDERAQILDRAITIAGIHEATYLALCRLVRDREEAA